MKFTEAKPPTIKLGEDELTLKLDIPAMRRLRRMDPPVDIMRVVSDDERLGLFEQLADDPTLAVDIAFHATKHDPKRPSDPETFAGLLRPDQLPDIVEAASYAVVLFTPDPKRREALLRVMDATGQLTGEAQGEFNRKMSDGTFDRVLAEVVDETRENMRAGSSIGRSRTTKKTSSAGSESGAVKSGSSGSGSKTSSKDSP